MEERFKNKIRRRGKFMFPFFMLAFLFLGGYAVKYLWNAIIPDLIPAVHEITYWKAVGLLMLCRLLFGGFKGRHHSNSDQVKANYWKEKMMNMSDEEKEKFKATWKMRCGKE